MVQTCVHDGACLQPVSVGFTCETASGGVSVSRACPGFGDLPRPKASTPRDVAYIQRIQNLVNTMPARLRKRVPTNFAERIRDTRNYYTHWSQRLEKRAAQEVDLYYLTSGARLLLDVTLLMELGFNKTQCTRLVERNDRLSKVLRAFDSSQPRLTVWLTGSRNHGVHAASRRMTHYASRCPLMAPTRTSDLRAGAWSRGGARRERPHTPLARTRGSGG